MHGVNVHEARKARATRAQRGVITPRGGAAATGARTKDLASQMSPLKPRPESSERWTWRPGRPRHPPAGNRAPASTRTCTTASWTWPPELKRPTHPPSACCGQWGELWRCLTTGGWKAGGGRRSGGNEVHGGLEEAHATRHTYSTATYLSSASSTRAQRRKRLDRAAAFVEGRMVVPVVPARMEKTAVLALRHLARAPRGTARIYFTVRARRSLARCPQPLAAVLVADLAALHSPARPTRARLRLSDRPPLLLPTSAHRCLPHTRPSLPADRPPLLLPTSHRCPALTGAFPLLGRPPASVPTQPSAPKLRP